MPAFECAYHGFQLAMPCCEHVKEAIEAKREVDLYLQRNEWGWFLVCGKCVRRDDLAEVLANTSSGVCELCMSEWVEQTGSDIYARCQHPRYESPKE